MYKGNLKKAHRIGKRGSFLLAILMLAVLALLSACSSGSSGNGESAAAGGDSAGYVGLSDLNDRQVRIGEIVLSLDDEAAPLIEKLGDAKRFDEYPSCFFQGSDKLWEYESLIVQTYPDGEKDYILSLEIMDDKPEIASGIKVGSSLKDLEEAYGDRLEKYSGGTYIYRVDELSYGIDFYIDGDKVSGINLYLIVE